ncbi:MAG: beta-aspartyl-peptidase [Candidatus Eiseniibacteriota bacterium]|jgi:beta-aspartyl-dipeptidase (metallo-type)
MDDPPDPPVPSKGLDPLLELIVNAEVHAPAPLGRRALLVGGGRVLWIGERDPGVPASVLRQCTDLEGRHLCPGLVDCHVHLTGGGGEAGPASRVPPLALGTLTAAGVTTVIGMLGTDDVTRDTASLVATARGLVAEGLDAYCLTGGYHLPARTLTGSIRDDIVFVDRILGLGEVAISDRRSSQPTVDELARVASESYLGGMLAGKAGTVHLHVGSGAAGLEPVRAVLESTELPPRILHPTHVNRTPALFEEAMALARQGCPIDVTAFPVRHPGTALTAADAVVRMLDSDVPFERLTVSSDAGGSLPRFDDSGRVTGMGVGTPATLLETLGQLRREGVAWEQALAPLTLHPSRVFSLPRKGRIDAGQDADLLVVDDDGRLTDVMLGGRWHLRDGRRRVRGMFERDDGD